MHKQSNALAYDLFSGFAILVSEVKNTIRGLTETELHSRALIATFDMESVVAVTFVVLVAALNEHAVDFPKGQSEFTYGSAEIWPLAQDGPSKTQVLASPSPIQAPRLFPFLCVM